ncbi:MAG: hypothetical protein ABI670_08210 [Chloroflexota bacterium]
MDVRTIIEFKLDQRLGNVALATPPAWIFVKDLERLSSYLEEHLTRLSLNNDTESDVFTNSDLDFTAQAFSGEVRSDSDGEFSIQFMVNVGRTEDGRSHTYIGATSEITVENANSFVASLRARLGSLSQTI